MRTEHDSLGDLALPDDAYYGIQTERAVRNFPISGLRIDPTFIHAYAELKRACALTNIECGTLESQPIGSAIVKACDEIIDGAMTDAIVTDVFQAGAGTSTNMNFNEVIANRALELLGHPRGAYNVISPNDHVNMSQSTNDTYPTAIRLAVLIALREQLSPAIHELREALEAKSVEFDDALKSARTHLQDAVPMTLGQEFGAWSAIVSRHESRLQFSSDDLRPLGIGGSAAGTGLNTPRGYAASVVDNLNRSLQLDLSRAENLFEAMQSLAPFVSVMSALKNLALDLLKMSADLRLLASGPMTGFAEIVLPAVQPGSSIMPGKVNPSILEMLSQVCLQVVGCEATVAMASQAGQLELNVMMPVVQFNCLFAIRILANAMRVTASRCVAGITADRERMQHYADSSLSLVTALAPVIGYLAAAEIAKEALRTKRSIRAIALERKLMSEEKLDEILNVRGMTKPHE